MNLAKKYSQTIDLYVTKGTLSETSFRRKLDPIAKNVIRNKNLLELVFKGVSKFDAQNPVIGSFIREIDIGEKTCLE